MKKKVTLTEPEQPAEIESLPENPKVKKPRKATGKKKVKKPEVVAETPPKKPARKLAKSKAKNVSMPGPKKMAAAKAEKPARQKPEPKKKVAEKPKKDVAVEPKKKPGRKPEKKATAPVRAVVGKIRGPKGTGLVGRQTDLIRMGEEAFRFALKQQAQIEEMERVIANYERVFAAVRGLFSREMEEIEELMAGLVE